MRILTLVLLTGGLMLLAGCDEPLYNQWDTPVGDDELARVVRHAEPGGYIVAGEKYYANGPADEADLYLVFVNDNGHAEWETTYSTHMHNEPLAALQTTDRGFLVLTERSNGSGALGLYLLKVDDGGRVEWMNEVSMNGIHRVLHAVGTSDGGFAILGYSGTHDQITVMKVDGAGALQFTRDYGDHATAADLREVDGGFILLNNVSRNNDSTVVELIRTDPWGEPQWSSEIWSYGFWIAWYVTQDTDGGFMIVGESNGGTLSSTPLVVKTDVRGNFLWRQDYDESSGATIYAVASGWSGPLIAGELSYDNGDRDGFAMHTNSSGDFLWWHAYGGSGNDWIQDVDVTDDGGFILAGSSASFSQGGDTDFYLLKISADGTRQWETRGGG